MSARRGDSGLCGILVVDKPEGLTSHDVVNRVRRACGERRVGHAGTLDPMATGLLLVLVGPATRLAPYLTAAEKAYRATVAFGAQTDTDDAQGEVVKTQPVPACVLDTEFARQTVASLVGVHQQVPPAFSAIKRGGEVAYAAARRGEALVIEPRTIEIFGADLVGVNVDAGEWELDLSVSKGTYIRAIARDLGVALGTAAHLGALRRTRSGALDVDGAISLQSLEAAEKVAALFVDAVDAVGLPVVEVSAQQAVYVTHGKRLALAPGLAQGAFFSVMHEGRLLAIFEQGADDARVSVVIPGGVGGGEQ